MHFTCKFPDKGVSISQHIARCMYPQCVVDYYKKKPYQGHNVLRQRVVKKSLRYEKNNSQRVVHTLQCAERCPQSIDGEFAMRNMYKCMASQKGHNVLPQPTRCFPKRTRCLVGQSENNALIWESNALVSKSTRCFSVSQQRVVFRCDNIQSQLI